MTTTATKTIAEMTKEEAIAYIWRIFDTLDAMPSNNLDDLVAKEKLFAQASEEMAKLPEEIREAVLNSKRPKVA